MRLPAHTAMLTRFRRREAALGQSSEIRFHVIVNWQCPPWVEVSAKTARRQNVRCSKADFLILAQTAPAAFAIFAAIRRLIPHELETKAWAMAFSGEGERETAMRPLLFILGIFAATLCVAQSAAAQNYPWCAYYGPHFGATNCGFSTFQQCLATISGIGGSCGANPMYQPPPGPGPHALTKHPRRRYSY